MVWGEKRGRLYIAIWGEGFEKTKFKLAIRDRERVRESQYDKEMTQKRVITVMGNVKAWERKRNAGPVWSMVGHPL